MPVQVLTFAGVAALLVLVPGPAVTLIMKNAALHGARHALRTAWGIFCADLVWASASIFGLTAVLVASGPAFLVVKLAGAAYLIYLGIRLLFWRSDDGKHDSGSTEATGSTRPSFREGFICDMANPKTVLVYASIIPQFVQAGPNAVLQVAVLGVTFAVIGFASLVAYTALFASARSIMVRSRVKKWLMRVSGGILTSFGIGLAASAR
ncbi:MULTISPECIES: LysE family translocator [Pseudonocardia]|uniref:Lysine transporter LysE n=1 Tax=Pseudonocardia saturnea TaxID=33909 RepID=A0ABQ0S7Y0_9PSEU|nr:MULTISPECIES: LysE family translocator [Pseudonocardia]GEC28918.1 lysine transporter LysE [Pseudonocardia saturnea]